MAMSPGRSIVTLPDCILPYPDLLTFLEKRFPHIPLQTWVDRINAGKVEAENGEPVTLGSKYQPGLRLFYHREVEKEPLVPFKEDIVFHNDHLLVACKPHFLPVTPAGPYVQECLVNRLKVHTGNMSLSPINRIDRETAGLVLISTQPKSRGVYQRMFMEEGRVQKMYEAICCVRIDLQRVHWRVENRLEEGEPWFRMKSAPGAINARTFIRLIEKRGAKALFELSPVTGKKHQLRLHLSSLGFPIVNDRYYPDLQEKRADDFSMPLQLLSRTITFDDPITGRLMTFESRQHLSFA